MNIRAIAMAGALAVVPMGVGAQESVVAWDMVCKIMGDMAESAITARQNGVPMSKMILIAADVEEGFGTAFWRAVVSDAYLRPRHARGDMQRQEIVEFRLDAERQCFKARPTND